MLRVILGVIAGTIAGVVVVMIVEGAGHMIFPPPEGTDLKDPEALKAIMHEIPVGAKIAVLLAWALGVFVGAAVAKMIAKSAPAVWGVAGVFAIFTGITLVQIPHPVWMIGGAIIAILVGALAANALVKTRG